MLLQILYIKELEYKLNNKTKNERKAGRNKKLSNQDIEQIKMYYIQKQTIEEIVQLLNVRVDRIYKKLKSNEKSTKKVEKIDMWFRTKK
ncbi:hypothetical protein [Tepidibacter mesophilus]|uniref:hypothetical protein n=1 Tax=Tepidibacter mesophilus TaxID=655607 RepID=UPI000C06F58D|nr:hypothetical protein [Tepidibacter mesophilus]